MDGRDCDSWGNRKQANKSCVAKREAETLKPKLKKRVRILFLLT